MNRQHTYSVSSFPTADRRTPICRERWKTDDGQNIKMHSAVFMPGVAENYYKTCSQTELHSRWRQDSLGLEKTEGQKLLRPCQLHAFVYDYSWRLGPIQVFLSAKMMFVVVYLLWNRDRIAHREQVWCCICQVCSWIGTWPEFISWAVCCCWNPFCSSW